MQKFTALFTTPGGVKSSVTACEDTLRDLCLGYNPGCGRPPCANGELKGLTVIFLDPKPNFITNRVRNTDKGTPEIKKVAA